MASPLRDIYDPDQFIPYLVRRTHQMSLAGSEPIFAGEGLTGVQWSALMLIYLKRCTTGADLARNLNHDKGATTRLIDALEEGGWVVRERCTADRRHINLAATDAGIAVAMRCKEQVEAIWNQWLGDWDDADVVTLIALLQKLKSTLETAIPERPCA